MTDWKIHGMSIAYIKDNAALEALTKELLDALELMVEAYGDDMVGDGDDDVEIAKIVAFTTAQMLIDDAKRKGQESD